MLLDPPLEGALNMARDHALALSLAEGEGVVRFYGWETPTVSLGRHEPAPARWREAEAGMGPAFVRRPTGGRAVLHDGDLTYAVAVPLRALGGARRAYARVNGALVEGLRSLGVPAALAPGGAALPPHAGPCFRDAAAGEVAVAGRKLVGSAQARIAAALLQHGSLRVRPGHPSLERLMEGGEAPGGAPGSPISLLEVLGAVPPAEALVAALLQALVTGLGGCWAPACSPGTLLLPHESSLLARYRSPAWTWRR